ncbi:hypothetical protein SVIOM74S_05802 [Streptomyces violarus]
MAYIIAPVFGWVRWDDEAEGYVRIVRKLYVDVPRRNGKTTLSGGIAVYLMAADSEPGAQVYAAATSEKQARYTFDPIKTIAERAPALKGNVKAYTKKITHPASGELLHGGVLGRRGHARGERSRRNHRRAARPQDRGPGGDDRDWHWLSPSAARCDHHDGGRRQARVDLRPEAAVRRAAGPRRPSRPGHLRRGLGSGRGRRPLRREHLAQGQPGLRSEPECRLPARCRRGGPAEPLRTWRSSCGCTWGSARSSPRGS